MYVVLTLTTAEDHNYQLQRIYFYYIIYIITPIPPLQYLELV